MLVLVTGVSGGIGTAIVNKFLVEGHTVIGMDIMPPHFSYKDHPNYRHILVDVCGPLPVIHGVQILINNAGVQNTGKDIDVNLKGLIAVTEKYGIHEDIRAIVNIASTSAHNGAEFPEYAASKGGVLAYTKNVAMRIAKYGATCNSISPGGVYTEMNAHIIDNRKLLREALNETLLGKWATPVEIADWVYFVAVINQSMTGQDIIIDNGEMAKFNFVW